MAQHPTQQRARDGRDDGGKSKTDTITNHLDTITTRQNFNQLREKAGNLVDKISTGKNYLDTSAGKSSEENPQRRLLTTEENQENNLNGAEDDRGSSRKQQDGKRTLIKNQLYLIEQLQLENANLRNERDQLQLENEELKFQLQMISSSNILSQPGSIAFNDRQLDKLVATDGDIVGTAIDNQSASRTRINSKATELMFDLNHLDTKVNASSDSSCPNASNGSSPSKLAAFPVGSHKKFTDSQETLINMGGQSSAKSLSQAGLVRTLSSSNHDLRFPILTHDTSYHHMTKKTTVQSLTTTPTLNKKLLNTKSISLSAFNVRTGGLSNQKIKEDFRLVDLDGNDDQTHSKQVVQKYGDYEIVQAAATVIQKAFREYRICKRFRTITEQLRHTCQPSQVRLDESKPNDQGNSEQRSESRQSYQSDESPIPFASGATRAATCESLSQAASHQAACAAATAAAKRKYAMSNVVAKSISCQQVASFASGLHSNPSKTSMSGGASINGDKSQAHLKSNSAMAAAINFQQLESIRKRQYRVGLNIFNKNPEKGVSFLIAHAFIDCATPLNRNSTSYYLSNQLHFMDKQKLTVQHQPINSTETCETANNRTYLTQQTLSKIDRRQNCRLCPEEENLKRNIAHFLLHRKGLAKEKIGEYLGNLQSTFIQEVLIYYLRGLDFSGLQIDVALRKFSSTLRMPGEAQRIERFVDRFACRYVQCQQMQSSQAANDYVSSTHDSAQIISDEKTKLYSDIDQNPCSNVDKNNFTMLSKDEIFILTFAIIMLNTDLHSPSLKSTNRMSASQFVNNLRGVFKSHTIHESDLIEIYERVKANQITTSPDHVTHVMKVQQGLVTNFQKKEIPNLCVPHRRLVCFCRLFEVYDETRKERSGQHQREIFLFNDILLVTKLARKARASAPQQYTYRQSIPLQGLCVQLSQSAHYNFGIKLCRRSNSETVIMFNARNELDQGRFVDDLNESIAEMDEMEHIRTNNVVESIHLKQLERLRRHALMHDPNITDKLAKSASVTNEKAIIIEDSERDQDNTSSLNYSSFNSNSAAGSLMASCTKPAKMRCTVTMAAPAPMVVEPSDK